MVDHDTFIASIQSTPAEEAPRLVYADWLDEQGFSDKAAYIRVVHSLTILAADASGRSKLVKRLLVVADRIDEEWRDLVSPRFDVILEGWLGGTINLILKTVRRLTRMQSLEEQTFRDSSRAVTLWRGVRREQAEQYLNQINPERHKKGTCEGQTYLIVPSAATSTRPKRGAPVTLPRLSVD